MRVKNLSLLLHIDEVSLHNMLEDQLAKNPTIESQLSVPILGLIEIKSDQTEVQGIKFANEGMAIELASDVAVRVPRMGSTVQLTGRLSLFVHVQFMVAPSGFHKTILSILDVCWVGNPSLRIGKTCHPKRRLQRLIDTMLPRLEKRMAQALAEHTGREKIELILADQLAPKGESDIGDWYVQHAWIDLQEILISDHQLMLPVDLSLDLLQVTVSQKIIFPKVHFHTIDNNRTPSTYVELSYQEVNHWLASNLTSINQQLSLPSDIQSLVLSSVDGYLICSIELKAAPESTFQIKSNLALNRDLQHLELVKVEIAAAEETGFLVKTLLRSTRRFIRSKIKKAFPIKIKPLQSELEKLLAAHTPMLVKSSMSKELLLKSIDFTDTTCNIFLDGQIKLAMEDYRRIVTDPDLG
ncbi:MAG: DUF4403 family protein [Saprospiraceae bacterium]|nr:DUF4403 family protein [Saprospiraceae bacterium]